MNQKFKKLIPILEKKYPVKIWTEELTPFEVLVAVVLSQTTSRQNTKLAFDKLRKNYNVTPKIIARASMKKLINSIKPAGLQNVKGPRLKDIAKFLIKNYDGDLNKILKLPKNEAREKLLELPGVGYKTADVVLSFVAGMSTFPVDVHIERISKRVGVVPEKAQYEQITNAWMDLVGPKNRRKMHLVLIEHGRETCKSRKPVCYECPIERYCEYDSKTKLPS